MTYCLVIGGEQVFDLASTRGWHEFKRWVDTLDVVLFGELVHFAEYGWSQDLLELSGQLRIAIQALQPADEAVYETAYWFLGALDNRAAGATTAFVSNGMGEGGQGDDELPG